MRLLLIFALTFTLSAQQDNKNNTYEESTENGNRMMTKVLDVLSEKHTMEIIDALNKNDVEKLIDCMEDECEMADFVELMEKILYFFKGMSHGDKPIYDLIKALVQHGPLAELVKELSEDLTLEIINALTAKEIGKLTSIGKKIVPIIKKANGGGSGVSKLISIFTGGRDGSTGNNYMLEKIMNALSEEHTMKMINAFNPEEVEQLTNCLEDECSVVDSVTIMEKMLDVLKGISHGDRLIYNLIKEHFKYGPLAELVNELSEECGLEIINTLNGKDMEILMNIGQGQVKKPEIISVGKKIMPIIKKAKCGKGGSKLMSIFTEDEEGNTGLPYYQLVPGGLHPGMSVYMQGAVPEHSNRTWLKFQVDFACGQHKGSDVPLHFRSHINAETVGLNTLQGGRWRKEEKHMNPFRNGEEFEAVFIVYDFGYQTLPYNHPVSGGLDPGMAVYVEGTVHKNARSIRIDFACGKFQEADILLHFNPRFGQGLVVLNTYQSHGWGREEKHLNLFQKGKHFEATFLVTETEYQVLVNGYPLCSYKHRIPTQFLNFVNFYGDLELQSLLMVGRAIEGKMMLTGSAFYYPPVPYRGNIPGGLGTNRAITVRGFILKNATSFEINLMAGQNIALHLKSHMKPWKYVVRNAHLNGKWGAEENDLPFDPFQFGQYFEVSICCDQRKFKVYASGRHLFNFAHRYAAIGHVRTLEIQGDVTLSYIKY